MPAVPVPDVVNGLAAYSAVTGVAVAPAVKAVVTRFWRNDKSSKAMRAVRARLLTDRPPPGDEAALLDVYHQVVGQLVDPDFLSSVDALLESGEYVTVGKIRSHLVRHLRVPAGGDLEALVDIIVDALVGNVGRVQADARGAVDVASTLHAARTIAVLSEKIEELSRHVQEDSSRHAPGPHETGIIAARLLTLLHGAAHHLGESLNATELGKLMEDAVTVAEECVPGQQSDTFTLRALLRQHGLPPRLLLTQLPGHAEALDQWQRSAASFAAVSSADIDSVELLSSVRTAVSSLFNSDHLAWVPEVARVSLHTLLSMPARTLSPDLAAMVMTIDAVLAPVESGSLELARVSHAAPSRASGSGAARRSTVGYVARQLCRLPEPDALIIGVANEAAQHGSRLLATVGDRGQATSWCASPPGVGASTFAVEIARAVADDFASVRYVDLRGLNAETRRSPTDAVRLIAEGLNIDLGVTTDEDELFAAFRSALADRRVLLILDDANDAAHVARFVPAPASCAVIVASRDRLQEHADPGLTAEVEPLHREDSITLLASATATKSDRDALDRIARLCDDVPLALRLARARLASRPDLDAADVAALLESRITRLDYLTVGNRAVRAAISLSYEHLDEQTCRILRFMAAAPTRVVTADNLSAALGEPQSSVELLMHRLVDCNVAQYRSLRLGDNHSVGRFYLTELIYVFLLERLDTDEAPEALERFRRRYIERLTTNLDALVGSDPNADVTLELDTAGVRSALAMAVEARWHNEGIALANAVEALAVSLYDLEFMDEVFRQRAALHVQSGTFDPAARALLRGGERLASRKSRSRAWSMLSDARELAMKHGLDFVAAQAAFQLSLLAAKNDEWHAALVMGSQAADTFAILGKRATAVPVAVNNSKVAERASKPADAVRWGREAWQWARSLPADPYRTIATFQYAYASYLAGDYGRAAELFLCAERRYCDAKDHGNAAVAARNAAAAAHFAGDERQELDLTLRAVALWEECDDLPRLADALVRASAAQFRAGNHKQAQLSLERAEGITRRPRREPLPGYLPYEISVRVLAIRLLATEPTPSNPHAVVGTARRFLPVRQAESRVDPELEPILDLICAVEGGELHVHAVREKLAQVLAAPTMNESFASELHLNQELGVEAAPQLTLSGGRAAAPADGRA